MAVEIYRQKVNDLNGRARTAAKKLGVSVTEIGRLNAGDLWAVYEYCGERCQWKGCQNTDVTFDHVEPLEHGGRNSRRNLGLLCESHNKAKGDNIIEDYRDGVICPDDYVAKQVMVMKQGNLKTRKQPQFLSVADFAAIRDADLRKRRFCGGV
jgi:hypothetical protein